MVRKILAEDAKGILVSPCWRRFLWFSVLHRIAVTLIDVPQDVQLYESIHLKALEQRKDWSTRIVVFKASGWNRTGINWTNQVASTGMFLLRELLFPHQDDTGYILSQLSSFPDRKNLHSVI